MRVRCVCVSIWVCVMVNEMQSVGFVLSNQQPER